MGRRTISLPKHPKRGRDSSSEEDKEQLQPQPKPRRKKPNSRARGECIGPQVLELRVCVTQWPLARFFTEWVAVTAR
jgi:hypothetical protein